MTDPTASRRPGTPQTADSTAQPRSETLHESGWTDPETGATVTTPSPRIVTITLDGTTHGYILGEVMPGKYARIIKRWKAARDE